MKAAYVDISSNGGRYDPDAAALNGALKGGPWPLSSALAARRGAETTGCANRKKK